MSSNLVSYSSGEEEEDKGRKHADANYDDVQMDMSDDNDEAPVSSEAAMFSSKEDFKAYQRQFTNKSSTSAHNKSDLARSSTEYGPGMAAASADRQPRRSTDNHSHHMSTSRKVDDPGDQHPRNQYGDEHSRNQYGDEHPRNQHHGDEHQRNQYGDEHPRNQHGDEHSRNHKDRRRDHDDARRRRHREGHHRRDRSRSRSRERGQHHRRRSRSRDRDDHRHRDRRQSRDDDNRRFPPGGFPPQRPKVNNSEQERQDSRSRKLQSLGLVNNQGDTLAAQMEKVKEITGVEVPKYYNPAAINPLKYAEQIKKRQMLWKKPSADDTDPQPGGSSQPATMAVAAPAQVTPEKKLGMSTGVLAGMGPRQPSQPAGSFNKWETTNFGNDKTNEKFRRLMGIKGGGGAPTPSTDSPSSVQKGSAKLFELQEQQYEKARAITHTARGLGLGFTPQAAPTPSTSALPPPGPSPLDKRDPVSYLKK